MKHRTFWLSLSAINLVGAAAVLALLWLTVVPYPMGSLLVIGLHTALAIFFAWYAISGSSAPRPTGVIYEPKDAEDYPGWEKTP